MSLLRQKSLENITMINSAADLNQFEACTHVKLHTFLYATNKQDQTKKKCKITFNFTN